jgi:hypothetical protein
MTIDARELNELTRKATDLMSETADVPRVLRNRLGEQHQLAQAAEEMQAASKVSCANCAASMSRPRPSLRDLD